jgi:hypothetical protein
MLKAEMVKCFRLRLEATARQDGGQVGGRAKRGGEREDSANYAK